MWLLGSPALILMDLLLWGCVKNTVYQGQEAQTKEELWKGFRTLLQVYE
jgi:hypothetical protein